MDELINRNYISIVKRGHITEATNTYDFLDKLDEELNELKTRFYEVGYTDPYEIADIILVCLNFAKHYNIDIERILNEKITINENRDD